MYGPAGRGRSFKAPPPGPGSNYENSFLQILEPPELHISTHPVLSPHPRSLAPSLSDKTLFALSTDPHRRRQKVIGFEEKTK